MSNTTPTATALKIFHDVYLGQDPSTRQSRVGAAPIVSITDSMSEYELSTNCKGLLSCDDWDKADYRMPMGLHDIACNVEITGRVMRYSGGTGWMRCKITFVGDCEPDTVVMGYAKMTR